MLHASYPQNHLSHHRGQATFDLSKSTLAVLNHNFVLCVLGNDFQSCPVNIQGTKVRLIHLQIPESSFLPFSKICIMFALPPSSGVPITMTFQEMMEKSVTIALARSLNTFRCIPSGPMGSCILHYPGCYLIQLPQYTIIVL